MSETIRVEVTEEDIREGERDNCRSCPIALALQRALPPDVELVTVGRYYARWAFDESKFALWFAATLPLQAKRFIALFDDGMAVEPFAFELFMEEE